MRADCIDPQGVVQCGCTDACVERVGGEWLAKLETLPTDEAKRDAIHRLRLDLEAASTRKAAGLHTCNTPTGPLCWCET